MRATLSIRALRAIPVLAAAVGAAAGLCTAPRHAAAAAAAEQVFETTITDPRTQESVAVRMWAPAGVKVLRGAICQGLFDGVVKRPDYQGLARSMDFALIGTMIRKNERQMPAALKALADRSGHPEVAHFPLVTMGFSAGGGVSIRLAAAMPDRVIAVVSNGNPGIGFNIDDANQLAAFRRIPVLTVNGSKDPFVDYDKTADRHWHAAYYGRIRQARLPWGLAMQWGKGHEYGNTNALAWPFIVEAVKMRLGDRTALAGPVKLMDCPEKAGWLGDLRTWETHWAKASPFSDDLAAASSTWLLNEQVACLWRAFVSKEPKVKLAVIAVPGTPGRCILRADGQFPPGTVKVEFYDGKARLGEAPAAPYEITTDALASGVHSVYAECTLPKDARLVTHPVLRLDGLDPARDVADK